MRDLRGLDRNDTPMHAHRTAYIGPYGGPIAYPYEIYLCGLQRVGPKPIMATRRSLEGKEMGGSSGGVQYRIGP